MPLPSYRLAGDDATLEAALDAVRTEFDVPTAFPPEVEAEADEAVDRARAAAAELPDATELPFLTIDPPGSMDLDQAMHLEADREGFRVRYAIADLSVVVRPGGAIDAETRRRGQTLYLPDERAPLHPAVLSEGACSLLPGEIRAAYVWDLRLDAVGELVEAHVRRQRVRSVARYDYGQVQALLDGHGEAVDPRTDAQLPLLARIGELRAVGELARGGASLQIPDQEIDREPDGSYRLSFRPLVPAEDHNAQISLLTGMAAARLMLDGGVGLLRTMPEPAEKDVARFRRQAEALGLPWPADLSYGAFLRTLDGFRPRDLALLHAATGLFRGAGYTPFDGAPPEQDRHSAIAAPYAHVTAPLRRLVDRFDLAICEALDAGAEAPAWVREALPELPPLMSDSDRRASSVARACTDAAEAAELAHRVGETFDAVVVEDRGEKGLVVQLADPAVVGRAGGHADLGARVPVTLREARIAERRVRFEVAAPGSCA
ncbi:RNB domain-containing ribonuclease [Mobilicoccus pelagius]|uniref:Putative ribonuclease n=1 Tax=Mobilicoccus pelagius NBRC 104925 TaxID=1089455 RepID=H5UQ15_9MICO|nr:RNB domain-containing ribonuclease [Mobilicoccus pelagius]GAB47820.1 putative ribonuclease [Mobilicoccus pelagius NBRC 104925]